MYKSNININICIEKIYCTLIILQVHNKSYLTNILSNDRGKELLTDYALQTMHTVQYDKLSLTWNDFQDNLQAAFEELRVDNDFIEFSSSGRRTWAILTLNGLLLTLFGILLTLYWLSIDFYWLSTDFYWLSTDFFCSDRELLRTAGDIQSYMSDGILRMRGGLS